MLSSIAANSELQTLIEECWRKRGDERRYTVPSEIKRKLCQLAVAHETKLRRDVIRRQRDQAAKRELRIAGYADAQIAEILSRRTLEHIDFEAADLDKVLEIVTRRAPATTLRRKAASRKLRHINLF
jgi:hypothetical protein